MAFAEHSVFCLMKFISSSLYGGSCTAYVDFRVIKDLYGGGSLVPLSQGVWTLIKLLLSFKLSATARLIFLSHTWHSVIWLRFTERVVVISGASSILQATALFPALRLEKSRSVSVL